MATAPLCDLLGWSDGVGFDRIHHERPLLWWCGAKVADDIELPVSNSRRIGRFPHKSFNQAPPAVFHSEFHAGGGYWGGNRIARLGRFSYKAVDRSKPTQLASFG